MTPTGKGAISQCSTALNSERLLPLTPMTLRPRSSRMKRTFLAAPPLPCRRTSSVSCTRGVGRRKSSGLLQSPGILAVRQSTPLGLIQGVHDLPVDIDFNLAVRPIADSHRLRAFRAHKASSLQNHPRTFYICPSLSIKSHTSRYL